MVNSTAVMEAPVSVAPQTMLKKKRITSAGLDRLVDSIVKGSVPRGAKATLAWPEGIKKEYACSSHQELKEAIRKDLLATYEVTG